MGDFRDALGALVDFYLEHGCPCLFPRFRAVVARDTSRSCGGSFTSAEQRGLIVAFEAKVPLEGHAALDSLATPLADMYQAKCGVCRSSVYRSSNEFAHGGWIDYLVIHPAPGIVDLGAPVAGGRLFRPCSFTAPAPGMAGIGKAAELFPSMPEDEWLAWMCELAAQ